MDCPTDVIYYFYNRPCKIFEDFKLKNIVTKWCRGMPNVEYLEEIAAPFVDKNGILIVLDDFGNLIDRSICDLFTVLSHSSRISVCYLSQCLFSKIPVFRDISLNVTMMTIMRNPRDSSQIRYIANQIYPNRSKFVVDVYNSIMSEPYSYVFLDFHQKTLDFLRVRSSILPNEFPLRVFIPKDNCADLFDI